MVLKLVREFGDKELRQTELGQTETGDHGGDATLEVEAALFVYSKKPLPPSTSKDYLTVSQIDLLPTISLLLDTPIAYSNLGAIIEDLFDKNTVGTAWKLNVEQVIRYASSYKIQNPAVQRSIKYAIQNYETQLGTDQPMADKELIHELRHLIFGTINNFDMSLIYIGLVSFVESLFCMGVLLIGYRTSLFAFIIFRTGLLFLQYAIYIGKDLAREDNSTLIYMAIYLSIAYSIVIILDKLFYSRWRNLSEIGPLLLPILLCTGLFSNSFIIYGATTGRFLIISMLVVAAIRLLHKKWLTEKRLSWKQIKGTDLQQVSAFLFALLVVRLSSHFNRCREEQVDCLESIFSVPTGLIVDANLRLFRLAIGILCTAISLKFYQNSANLHCTSTRIAFSFAWLSLLPVYFNWACEASGLNAYRQAGIYSAQFVFLVCLLIITISFSTSADFFEFGQSLKIVLFLVFLLLLSDGTATSFALAFVVSIIWKNHSDQFGPLFNGIFYTLLSNHLFYSLGHHATFASIPWNAAFVGLPSMANKMLPATMVLVHIYSGTIFCSFEASMSGSNFRTAHVFLTLEGLKTFASCLSGVIQRRHLMFFKIFAPNFLFNAVGFVILCVIVILTHILHLIRQK